MCGERRCQSIGNLHYPQYLHPIEKNPARRALKASKSASNSRSSLRSAKKRAPQPPGQQLYRPGQPPSRTGSQRSRRQPPTELVYVPGHYEEVPVYEPADVTDPDLVFDDPRDGLYDPHPSHSHRPLANHTPSIRTNASKSEVGSIHSVNPADDDSVSSDESQRRRRRKKKPTYRNPYAPQTYQSSRNSPVRSAARKKVKDMRLDSTDDTPTAQRRHYSDDNPALDDDSDYGADDDSHPLAAIGDHNFDVDVANDESAY